MKADIAVKKGKDAQPVMQPPLGDRVKSEIIAWFWVILAFMLINGTLGQARVIPSGSMEDTLLIGVHVPLWRNPKRQQIIIFKPPFDPAQPDYVKRVIGLPGDEVDIRDGAVWINGKRLNENYTLGPSEPAPPGQAPRDYEDVRLPYKVPENCYFAMGDNRENSYDSRFWGCVPRQDILGTPVIIYMSLDAPKDAWNGDLGARFLAYANAVIHPGTVRWRRLFHMF